MSEELNDSIDPVGRFRQAQLNLLSNIEGKHGAKPALLTVLFAMSATLIEAAISFILLYSEDNLLAALVSTLFPVILLWTIAAYQATYVNLPKQYDELIEQYEKKLDV